MTRTTTATTTGRLAVVIGASGGIGAALLAELQSADGFAAVLGLSRQSTPTLDLTDGHSIQTAGLLHSDDLVRKRSQASLINAATAPTAIATIVPRRIVRLCSSAVSRVSRSSLVTSCDRASRLASTIASA